MKIKNKAFGDCQMFTYSSVFKPRVTMVSLYSKAWPG